jgi:hypothetical protein
LCESPCRILDLVLADGFACRLDSSLGGRFLQLQGFLGLLDVLAVVRHNFLGFTARQVATVSANCAQ